MKFASSSKQRIEYGVNYTKTIKIIFIIDNQIKENFRFSILDIYKSTTNSEIIIERESWWKETLLSRKFGYNAN